MSIARAPQNAEERVETGRESLFPPREGWEDTRLPKVKVVGDYDSFIFKESGFRAQDGLAECHQNWRTAHILHRPIDSTIKTLTLGRVPSGKCMRASRSSAIIASADTASAIG